VSQKKRANFETVQYSSKL